ncbi:MAG: hypothetical protein R3B48_04610 [Kofleriaceae bacterium]
MAKVIAPVGSHFLLTWTTDAYVEMVNRFHLIDGTDKEFPGRPPRSKINKGKITAVLTITKDGKPDGYRTTLSAPNHAERFGAGAKFFHEYSFIFKARKPGDYVFSVAFTAEPAPGKNPPAITAPPPILKEVTVTPEEPVNDRRKDMLALIDKWFPSSVYASPKIPPGETQDILARGGWDKTSPRSWTIPERYPPGPIETLPKQGLAQWVQTGAVIAAQGEGQRSAAKASYNRNVLPGRQAAWAALSDEEKKSHPRPLSIPIDTSCLSVMGQLVSMWGGQFKADLNTMLKADPAFYVKAIDEFAKPTPTLPKPGDILYLSKEKNRGEFQHVCILVSRSTELWVTADGGGGGLPEQTATVNDKPLSWTTAKPGSPSVPMFVSVTDGKAKALHGWVDLDRVPNDKYNADGSRK